ncbi:MAG: FAD:protein FMN transferase, partial [Chromatiaceae bacterium]|nr:FAD:protein FMN transferase [Chromatiaceae bacterium]
MHERASRRPSRPSPARLCLLASLVLMAACSRQAVDVVELTGSTMGTTYSIKLAAAPDPALRDALQRQVEQRLHEINTRMSTYLADSDLMRFNRNPSTEWQPAPPELVQLVEQANRISAQTGGMYDITVGPLVNLWGFGNAGPRATAPATPEVAALLKETGYGHLQTRQVPPALRKDVAGLQIDLSSIAKGWAVDQLAQLLLDRGIGNFLVEIGGELRASGQKAANRPWRVAIERPVDEHREVQRVIGLRDLAMATSGDYRNFFENNGRRFSHTISPKTGLPVQHSVASVSVVADNCALADAWATALMALGEQRGPE